VLYRLAANGDLDATSLGNLIYMVEIGRFDVASLMRWLVKLAAENPSVLQEIRLSHDNGDHTSPLTDAFVLETLRLHQSERLMRIALEDLSFDGYHIPKHTVVRLCLWESHKDPETFEDPFRFDPRRFVDENYTSDQYAPFGLGRRRCPASDMAIAMAASLVSTMANDVSPSIVEDGPPIHGAWHWEPNPSMRVSWRLAESTPAEPDGSGEQAR
jgi:cytochrome P450